MKRTRFVVAAMTVGVLALSGCGSSGGGTVTVTAAQPAVPSTPPSAPVSVKVSVSASTPPSSAPPVSARSTPPSSAGASASGGGGADGGPAPTVVTGAYTSDEMALDVSTAIEITNRYWATHWSEFFTGTYQPPSIYGQYNGMYVSSDSRFPGPSCGGQAALADNAFYCNPEDYLAWDLVLMSDAYTLGDAFLYYVIAHEWGHAIQNRLDSSLVAVAKELQADCLAAATLYGAVADGTLQLESGDEGEITNALTSLSDTSPWAEAQSHGSPFERIEWFDAGRKGGVATCLNVS